MSLIAGAGAFLAVAALLRWAPTIAEAPPRWLLAAVVAASAVGALLAPGEPTGVAGVDAVARAALGAAVAYGGAVSPFASMWAAGTAGVGLLVAHNPAGPAAGAAVGTAAAPLLVGTASPLAGAVAAGLATQSLLRLDWPLFTGASTLLAAAGFLPALVAAGRQLPERARRPVGWAVGLVVVFGLLASIAAALAAASVATDVEAAVGDAQRGLDLLGDDDAAAQAALREAADGFAAAEDQMDAPWALPSRLVPFVAQQSRAVATMASAGHELASAAADAVEEADVDALRPVDGRLDLAAVERVDAPLDRAAEALLRAQRRLDDVDSPWLLAPLASRYGDLSERVDDAADDAGTATLGADVAPALLGADEPRRYLLLVQQLAEARGSGGLPGNYGEIVADNGVLDLVRFGRLDEIQPPDRADRTLTDMEDRLGPYGEALDMAGYLENSTAAPDFPTTAEVFRQLYPQSGGSEVDGVISVDPIGFAALLGVTGPITLEDGTQLDSSNAAEFLLHDQYAQFSPTEGEERADLLGEVATTTWDRLTTGTLPSPPSLAASLGDAVRGGHIRFASFDPAEQEFFDAAGLAGAVPTAGPSTDGVGAVTQNLNGNKIDWFLTREVSYDVHWDPGSGEVRGDLRVRLHNAAPASGEAKPVIEWGGTVDDPDRTAPGENAQLVALYTRFPAADLAVDGVPVAGGFTDEDHGWSVFAFIVRIPPGGTVEVTASVAGLLDEGRDYRFVVPGQPSIADPSVSVGLETADGWAVAAVAGPATDLEPAAGDGATVAFDVPALAPDPVVVTAEPAGSSLLDRVRGHARR